MPEAAGPDSFESHLRRLRNSSPLFQHKKHNPTLIQHINKHTSLNNLQHINHLTYFCKNQHQMEVHFMFFRHSPIVLAITSTFICASQAYANGGTPGANGESLNAQGEVITTIGATSTGISGRS